MKSLIVLLVFPPVAAVLVATWLWDIGSRKEQCVLTCFLLGLLLMVLVVIWAMRERFRLSDLGRQMGAIDIALCTSMLLALIGATSLIQTQATGWAAPEFRSGMFLLVYCVLHVVILLIGRISLRKRQRAASCLACDCHDEQAG